MGWLAGNALKTRHAARTLRGVGSWAAVAAVGVALPHAAQAEFSCAALRPSASQQPAYGRVDAGRCEGYFEQSVSQPFIELVSLTRGAARLASAAPTGLSAPGATRLVIQPLRAAPLYRIDAGLREGQALPFDPAPMLSATGLRPDDLGFLARDEAPADGPPRLAAVALAPQDGAAAGAVATIRPSVALSAVAWRAYAVGGDAPAAWQTSSAAAPYAWQPLSLPLALPPAGPGLRVDVRATDRQGRAVPLLSFIVVTP